MGLRATEPQTIGGVLDWGFKLFSASFTAVVPIIYVGTLIGAIAGYLLTRSFIDPTGAGFNSTTFFVGILVVVVISLIIFAAALARIRFVARDEPGSLGDALGLGLRRFPAVLVASIAYGIAVAIGMVALLVPGIFLSVSLAFCFYAAAADNKGPFESLSYSYDLVKGNWWRSAAILTLILIILIVFQLALVYVSALFVASDPAGVGEPSLLLDVIISPILSAIISTLSYCLAFAVYEDLRLRKEGTDIASRIEGLSEA